MKSSQPLGLAYIAGSIKAAGHAVTVIDTIAESPEQINAFNNDLVTIGLSIQEIVARIPKDTDVIGFSCMFSMNWMSDRMLIDAVGEAFPGVVLIAGGEHITATAEFSLSKSKHLDVCVLGEGEETIVELLKAIDEKQSLREVAGIVFKENGENVTTTPRKRVAAIDAIPWPEWSLFPMDKYYEHSMVYGVDRGKSVPIMATRGCPFSCTFCSSPDMWGTTYAMRNIEDVVDEIQYMQRQYQIVNFDFFDLTAIVDKKWIIRFCETILERNIKMTWQIPAGTRSEAITEQVTKLLYESGCRNITYAPESGSPEILRLIKKRVILRNMLRSMRFANAEGMNIKINMIMGFPEEHHKHIWETLKFLIQASWIGVHDMAPSIFQPYPGSALFRKLIEDKKINMESDEYFYELIYVDSFLYNKFYNDHIHPFWLKFYQLFAYLVFYGSNYLFRPIRFFVTVKNIYTQQYESRSEMALGDLFKRLRFKKNQQSVVLSNTTKL
ncbi:MAG: radical SAM protein [Chitinophagales bacterium]|nr:radical SAM protein [Chitinophagales bacterium]